MRGAIGTSRPGFTLLEATVVLALTAVLAVTAVPAVRLLEESRRGAAADEVAKAFRSARSSASAIGEPVGVRIDAPAGEVQRVVWSGGPLPAVGMDGSPVEASVIPDRFGGTTVERFSADGVDQDAGAVWFSPVGGLVLLDAEGRVAAEASTDAEVGVQGGWTVRVDRRTGMVEVLR